MKAGKITAYCFGATTLALVALAAPLSAQNVPPDSQKFLSPGEETMIQINNVLVGSSNVCIYLGGGTFARLGKLVVLDSLAFFSGNSPDGMAAKEASPIEDVVVLTKYVSDKELVRATVAMSPSRIEEGNAIVVENELTADDLFGPRGGYVHPFLSITGEYTDNIYNINVDEKDNFLTILSSGAWLGVPRIRELPLTLSPYNAAAGGTRYSVAQGESFNRFQTYLLAGISHKIYSADTDLNHTAWRVEGMYQQNLPAGISFRAFDRYAKDRDRYDFGSFQPDDFTINNDTFSVSSPSLIRDYSSNQGVLNLNLDMSERFSAQFDYTNFWLDYEEMADDWLDRVDNNLSLSLAYHHSPKTSLFVQYVHTFLSYEEDAGNDSENRAVFGGVNWKGSAKTSLMLKSGYQQKDYSNIATDSRGTFAVEGQFNYLITDKTKVAVNIYKAIEETDSLQSRGMDTIAAKLRYDQRFSYKIQGYLELWHETNDHDGFMRSEFMEEAVEPRKDTRFLVKPGILYHLQDWLIAELSYSVESRNSTDNEYDFTTQTVFFGLNASF